MFNLCNSDHLKAGLFIEKVPSLNTISDLPGTPEIEPGKELTLSSTIRGRSDGGEGLPGPGRRMFNYWLYVRATEPCPNAGRRVDALRP